MRTKSIVNLISIFFIFGPSVAGAINFFDDNIDYWPDEKKMSR